MYCLLWRKRPKLWAYWGCSITETAWIMSVLRVQAGKDKWPPTYKAWERVCRPNPGTRVEFSCCSSFCCCWERSLALTSYIASFSLRLGLNRPYKPCFFWETTVGRIENLRHGSFQKVISRFINFSVLQTYELSNNFCVLQTYELTNKSLHRLNLTELIM